MISAIEIIKSEIKILQSKLEDCVNDAGYIKSDRRYEYQNTVSQLKAFRESLEYLESQFIITLK